MSTCKSLLEWIQEYEQKTGDTFRYLDGFTTWYIPDRGFCQWKPLDEERTIFIYNLCNDAKFWRDALECHAMQYGYDRIMAICTRHILPYIKYWGWEIMQDFEKDGYHRYICKDKCGREIVISPKHLDSDDGSVVYWVNNELKRQYKPWENDNERA